MEGEAAHSSLNYAQVKDRSLASRSYRTKIQPNNGSDFKSGQVIYIDLPSGLPATYVDFRNSVFLKFKINIPAGGNLTLDKAFAMSWLRRFTIEATGTQLMDVQGWNVLCAAFNDLSVGADYKTNQGTILAGAGQKVGVQLAAGSYTFAVPLTLNCFSMCQRAIPLFGNDRIQLRLTVDDPNNWGNWTAGSSVGASISEVELTCDFVELSAESQYLINNSVGGVYNIMTTGIQNYQTSITASPNTALAINRQIGISVASLEKMIFVFRNAANNGAAGKYSLGSRCFPAMTSLQLFVNNLAIPQRPITGGATNCSEYLAELLIAQHSLSAIDYPSSLNMTGTGDALSCASGVGQSPYYFSDITTDTAASVGSFLAGINLETLTQSKSDRLYGGINTISSNVQVRLTSQNTRDVLMDVFSFYSQLLTLNTSPSGMNVWETSM